MFTPKSDFLRLIVDRGYLHQCTGLEELDALAAKGPITAYIGFDATADSLHVGSMVQIMLLRRLQQTGHRAIALMGGGTTKIGDPSFRDHSRPLLDEAAINANLLGIRKVFDNFLKFGSGPTDAIMVNNADWLEKLNYIDFLRDFGRHFGLTALGDYYKPATGSGNPGDPSVYDVLGGPEIRANLYGNLDGFIHGLFGFEHTGGEHMNPDNSFAGGFGGQLRGEPSGGLAPAAARQPRGRDGESGTAWAKTARLRPPQLWATAGVYQ